MAFFQRAQEVKMVHLGKGFSGAGFFALRGEANVVPCAIIGPYKPFRKLKVVFGDMIDIALIVKEKLLQMK